MSDEKLREFGKAARYMTTPRANLGKPPHPDYVLQLEEAKADGGVGILDKHDLLTFMNPEYKIVETGCSTCQKHLGTVEQFKRHLTDDVLQPLLDKLSVETK